MIDDDRQISRRGDRAVIRFDRHLAHAPDALWAALTDHLVALRSTLAGGSADLDGLTGWDVMEARYVEREGRPAPEVTVCGSPGRAPHTPPRPDPPPRPVPAPRW